MRHKADERLTITVPQAARVLGISRGLAYQMARQGTIPTLRFGRRLVVPRKAIDRMLQEASEVNLRQSTKEKRDLGVGRNDRGQLLNKTGRRGKHLYLETEEG